MLLILCFALAWMIRGAAVETWGVGRAAARSGVANVRARTRAARSSPRPGVRRAAWIGTGVAATTGGLFRGLAAVDTAIGRGARRGWAEGRDRGRQRREEHRRRSAEERRGQGPTWRHWLTGLCPSCDHPPRASAAETDGCECDANDWGCPCAMRHRAAQRRRPPGDPGDRQPAAVAPDAPVLPFAAVPPPGTPPPVHHPQPPGGDLRPPEPEGDPMSDDIPTGEVATIAQARAALEAIQRTAAQQLDMASAALEQSRSMAEAAELMLAGLTEVDLDPDTIGEINAMRETVLAATKAADELVNASDATEAAAGTALHGLNSRHAVLEEAHAATEHAAKREAYQPQ